MTRALGCLGVLCIALGGCHQGSNSASWVLIVCHDDRYGTEEPIGIAPDENAHIVTPGGGDGVRGYSRCHYQRVVPA
jgi:hypothetical protein